jgi:hypothetical protein
MVTRNQRERDFVLQGVVVDSSMQRGVEGLQVTAWTPMAKQAAMLGQAITDAEGAFAIGFDRQELGDAMPENGVEVFFKVRQDAHEVLNTADRPLRKLQPGTTHTRLEVELPQQAPLGEDRVAAEQALKAIDWWQASDFRGLYKEGKNKTWTVAGVAMALLGDAGKNGDFKPLRPGAVREKEIINQTPDSARVALAQQQAVVTEVKPLSSLRAAGHLSLVADYPLQLRPNDRITLYEENGIVKFYTRDPAPVASADSQTVARIDGDVQSIKAQVAGIDALRADMANVQTANAEVETRVSAETAQSQAHAAELERLHAELARVQQASANKDAQIARLQSDLRLVTKAQDELAGRVPLSRIDAIEKQLALLMQHGRLKPPDPPTAPGTPAAPGTPEEGTVPRKRAPAKRSRKDG